MWGLGAHGKGVPQKVPPQPKPTTTATATTTVESETGKSYGDDWKEVVAKGRKSKAGSPSPQKEVPPKKQQQPPKEQLEEQPKEGL